MPELPEVESIASSLRQGGGDFPSMVGARLDGAQVLWAKTLVVPNEEEFQRRISGHIVKEINRRGKFLVFNLSSGDTLLVHLRMSGDLMIEPSAAPNAVHHRLLILFDNVWRLAFYDSRKFGRVWLVADPQDILGGLGPEPLEDSLTDEMFFQRLGAFRRQLKPLLLDQSFLAGLGNIYTDEALYSARQHPLKISNTLSRTDAACLLSSIRSVLNEGIRRNGASIDWVYRGGNFQNYFRVYQRTGEPCQGCGTSILRILVGQRGTHFCPVCQAM